MFTYFAVNNLESAAIGISVLVVALVGCMLASISDASGADESLQFSKLEEIHEWRKGNDAMVFVQGQDKQWYEAQLDAACMRYDTSKGIRFITKAGDVARRVSKVIVGRRICTVTSLTRTDEPRLGKPQ